MAEKKPVIVETVSKDAVLDRIRKLVNLAASPNLKEAKNAAHLACALIRENNLDVMDPDVIDKIYERESLLKAEIKELQADTPRTGVDWGMGWQGASPPSGLSGYSTMRMPSTSGWPTVHGTRPVMNPTPMTSPILMTAKLDGHCLYCGTSHKVGDQILWQRGFGIWCPNTSCFQDWNVRRRGGTVGSPSPFTP